GGEGPGARLGVFSRVESMEPAADRRYLVSTNRGQILARRIVVAAGAQTRHIGRLVALDLPVLVHPIQVFATESRPPMLRRLIQHAGTRPLSLRQTTYATFVILPAPPPPPPPP